MACEYALGTGHSGGIARFSARGAPGWHTQAHVEPPTHRARGALAYPLERVHTRLRDGSVRPFSQERAAEPCACMSDQRPPDPYRGIWLVPGRSRVRAKLSGPAARQVSSQLTAPNPPACTAWLLRRMQAQPWQTVHAPPARGRCRLASKEEGGGRRPSCALQYGRPMGRRGRGRPDYHQIAPGCPE